MGEDESKPTRIRCLDTVRYAVAGLVTVLTIAVIALAIVQSLRPEVLQLSIVKGYVVVGKIKSMSPPVRVNMLVTVHATNPGGRAAIWYDNATVHFLYNKSSNSEITYLNVEDNWLPPLIERNMYVRSSDLQAPGDVPMEFVRKMFMEQDVKNATVIFEGTLRTQVSAVNYTRGSYTKYTCFPVTIGTSPQHGADVPCVVG